MSPDEVQGWRRGEGTELKEVESEGSEQERGSGTRLEWSLWRS